MRIDRRTCVYVNIHNVYTWEYRTLLLRIIASTCGKGKIAGLCVYQMMPCLLSTLRAYRCTNHNLQAELQSRPPTLAPRGEWVYMYYRMLLISICVIVYYRLNCLSLKLKLCACMCRMIIECSNKLRVHGGVHSADCDVLAKKCSVKIQL